MPFSRPSLTALQQQAVADIQAANLPSLTGQLLPKSVLRTLSTAQAGLAWLHYGYLDWIARQSVPYTSTQEYLEGWAALKGVLRKPATAATGQVTFTGTDTSVIPAGAAVQRSDGQQYTLATDLTISGSSGSASVTASTTGTIGNAVSGTSLTLNTPIVGITTLGSASSDLTGGADVETDDSLRTRMLLVYRNPPMGGAASDYVEWALEVPGVSRAWAQGDLAGPGTVTVWTMFDISEAAFQGFPQGDDGAATLETRASPATGDLLLVADHIFPLRPVTALVYSVAPLAYPIDVTISNLAPNTVAIRNAISDAITATFIRIGSPKAMTVFQSDIVAAIESVPGIREFVLVSPDTTAVPIGYLPTLGSVIYE